MRKNKRELIEIIRRKLGPDAGPEKILDLLEELGVMDPVSYRNAVAYEAYLVGLTNTTMSTKEVQFTISAQYDMSRGCLRHIIDRVAKH